MAFGERAFEYAAFFTRNSLPPHVSQSKTITISKKAVKTYFLNKHLSYHILKNTVTFKGLHCNYKSYFIFDVTYLCQDYLACTLK